MPKIVDHEQRRAAITETAAALIARGGLEAATVREIARHSGYSKGIIEHYFDGKSELIDAALGWANERYLERIRQTTAGLVGLDSLRARLKATVPSTLALRNEWKIRLINWSIAAIDPGLQKHQAARTRDAVAHFAADLDDARSNGEIDALVPIEPTARQILFSATGLSCAILHNPRAYNKNAIEAEIERIVATSTTRIG